MPAPLGPIALCWRREACITHDLVRPLLTHDLLGDRHGRGSRSRAGYPPIPDGTSGIAPLGRDRLPRPHREQGGEASRRDARVPGRADRVRPCRARTSTDPVRPDRSDIGERARAHRRCGAVPERHRRRDARSRPSRAAVVRAMGDRLLLAGPAPVPAETALVGQRSLPVPIPPTGRRSSPNTAGASRRCATWVRSPCGFTGRSRCRCSSRSCAPSHRRRDGGRCFGIRVTRCSTEPLEGPRVASNALRSRGSRSGIAFVGRMPQDSPLKSYHGTRPHSLAVTHTP
jgi:hypothetical protein